MKALAHTHMHTHAHTHTHTHIQTHTAMVKHTLCIYNSLTHHPHTDTVSAAKEMILNLQEGYQIAPRNKKNVGRG